MENNQRLNNLQHVFSFEDLYQEEEEFEQKDDKNKYELYSLGKKNSIKRKKSSADDYSYKKKLTKNSKFELIIRISLLSIALIFIPLSIMSKNNFNKKEQKILFKKINKWISKDILKKKSSNNIFFIYKIIQNKDFMLGIASVLYIICHPFISLKIVISSAFFHYINTFIKCINQARRPLWEIINYDEINDIIECETSYSSPSDEIFFLTFYFIYPIFCIRSFYSKGWRMHFILKIILLIVYLALMIFEYFYLLFYKLNYLYEIIFTNMLTLLFICILLDFDNKLQKKISDSTKNLFKARKNKIKMFIFAFALFFFAVLIYNFIIPDKILIEVIEKLSKNESCSKEQKETLGMESTFINMSFIFCMIGAYWGACLTIEYNPGEWWYQPLIIDKGELDLIKETNNEITTYKIGYREIVLLILKSIIMVIIYSTLWFCFYQIPYITFEFKLLVNCIKYFIIPFICFGILPILYGFLHMNKKVGDIYDNLYDLNAENEDWSKNLFGATLFVNYQEKARYPYIHLKRN